MKRVTIVVDTNVLLDYLVVIQKLVGDIEKTEWPSVVLIPGVVISELDWYVDPSWEACLTTAGGLKKGLPG